ncbi:helix-turn-helix domain-containing protein [Membranihabitans maritimus]|uniref:helix-turn-helix domain-containing protein n=1 Tax=Membranihabitans maritimus TaxID=2904244 RepID=UPI001F2E26A0|nr:helix-turn-helix transcriptional regulator [Membranihabitans maritimus]
MTEEERKKILLLFGENIKKIREDKQLSLLQADYQSNIDESNISKYEHGKRDLRLSTIFKIAKMLKTHPKNLLDLGIDYTEED